MIGEGYKRALTLLTGALRADSWQNWLTGFGTPRDKTTHGEFVPDGRIIDQQLSAMYHHNDIAKRVVNIVPREMLREGFGIACDDPQAAERIALRVKSLGVLHHVKDAAIWGRLFGGSLVLIGANDGQDPREPLDENRLESLSFLQVYDRRRAQPESWYEDERSPQFGESKVYRLTNYRTGGVSYVHETRLIRFGGAHTGDYERWQQLGWDYSILQDAHDAIRQFSDIYKASEILMTDASQGVFKIKGLMAMIAGGQLQDLQTRAQLMDITRSLARAVMLDAEGGEEFTKVQTTFAGIAEMLDRSANRLSAAVEIPVTLLMGQAPAGLQATGASDIRTWYDKVQADRELILKPRLERLIYLISLAEKLADRRFSITFKPLWQETPKEKSDREKVEADTAKVWIDCDVLTPEQVGIAQFSTAEKLPYRIDPKGQNGWDVPNPAPTDPVKPNVPPA